MNRFYNLVTGILLALFVFSSSVLASRFISFQHDFSPKSIITHSTMMVLSVIGILIFSKSKLLKFSFNKVRFKYYIYGVLIAFAGFIIANVLASVILSLFGFAMDPSGKGHLGVANMNFVQFLLFVFVYASICEEFFFRGFIQNYLHPLKSIGLIISKNVFISLPVVLSGVLFGLGHLILLSTETSGPVIFRIVLMTSIVGIIAGYFQEKHKSILPAIVIHMTANLPGLLMLLIK